MSDFTQPERTDDDGPVEVRAVGDRYVINATHCGQGQTIVVTGFNAYRVLGALAQVLGVSLARAVAKKIRMT